MNTPTTLPKLVIGDMVATFPIIQGGMGIGISMAILASAVANEGGIGVIATAGIGMNESDLVSNFVEANTRALRKEIQKARSLTKGLIGVNIMAALSNYESLARTAMDEKIDAIVSGAGLPMNLPAYKPEGSKTKLIPIISSARAAAIIAKRWIDKFNYVPDAFVVEGPLAGGHLGFKPEQIPDPAHALENLIPEIMDTVRAIEDKQQRKIPVIAGGGIYTGADIHRFLKMGVAGVQMATRFVTTVECDASDAFKNAYVNAKESDIVIIKSPVGLPGRAIRNKFITDINEGQKKPYKCTFHCIVTCDVENSPYCIAHALLNARKGNFQHGFAFAGANAWRATEITTVKKVVDAIKAEYQASFAAG